MPYIYICQVMTIRGINVNMSYEHYVNANKVYLGMSVNADKNGAKHSAIVKLYSKFEIVINLIAY